MHPLMIRENRKFKKTKWKMKFFQLFFFSTILCSNVLIVVTPMSNAVYFFRLIHNNMRINPRIMMMTSKPDVCFSDESASFIEVYLFCSIPIVRNHYNAFYSHLVKSYSEIAVCNQCGDYFQALHPGKNQPNRDRLR